MATAIVLLNIEVPMTNQIAEAVAAIAQVLLITPPGVPKTGRFAP